MLHLSPVDYGIVASYLLICLVIGSYRTLRINNIKDYAVGNKDFATIVIISTIYATHVSANQIIAKVEQIYKVGIVFALALFFMPVAWLLVKYIYAKNIDQFSHCISISEIMHELYGKPGRYITNIITIVFSIGIIAVQATAIGYLFNYFLGTTYIQGVLIGSGILIFYSIIGGIRAVALTDVFQFLIFFIALPLAAGIAYVKAGGINNIIQSVPTLSVRAFYEPGATIDFFSYIFFASLPSIGGPFAQRLLMSRDKQQLLQSYNVLIVASICLALILVILGFSIKAAYPDIEAKTAFYHFMLQLPPVLIGFMVTGMLAVMMSTADSWLNSLSVTVSHDVIKNAFPTITNIQEVIIARIVTCICGCLAVIMALNSGEIFKLILMSQAFNYPITLIPITFGMLKFKTNSISFVVSTITGFSSVVMTRILAGKFSAATIMFGTIGSAVGFFVTHYIQFPHELQILQKKILFLSKKLMFFAKTLINLSKFSLIEEVDEGKTRYFIMFSVLILVLNIPAFIFGMHSSAIPNTLLFARIASSVFCIFLCMHGYWWYHKKAYNFLTSVALIFCLPFIGSYCLFLSNYEYQWMLYWVLSSIIFYILIPLNNFIVLYVLATIISYVTSHYVLQSFIYQPYINLLDNELVAIYYTVMLSVFLFYIIYDQFKIYATRTSNLYERSLYYNQRITNQQNEIDRLNSTAQKILNNVNHELRLPVGNVINFSKMLYKALQKSDDTYLQEVSKHVHQNSTRLSSMILNMLDLAALDVHKIDLQRTKMNLSKLVKDRINNCCNIYLEDKKIDFELKIQSKIFVSVDPNYIMQVVDNLVINAIKFSQKGKIIVKLLKQNNLIKFSIKDNGIGIPKEELYDIFTPFKMGSNTESKAEGRGVGLALCKAAIEAHQGSIAAQSDGKNGATFTFTLKEKF